MKLGRGKRAQERGSRPVALPGHGDALTLVLPAGERLPGRVVERGINTLLLAVTVIARLEPDQLEGLVVEFTAPHGRVRLQGRTRLEDGGRGDVVRMDEPRSVEVLQEREFVRIDAARPVLVYTGEDVEEVQSYTVDVSGGGFLLAGPDTLAVGAEVTFELLLRADAPPIRGTARVVRVDREGRRAACYERISELDRRRLVRFIFDCQREERRRGLLEEDGHGG